MLLLELNYIKWDKIKDTEYLMFGQKKTYKYNIICAHMI